MAREILTEGIVLRRWYAGEYDKWVSFLTPEHGKLRLRVRGARKPKSKMGMLTEPLNLLRARVIEGKAQQLIVQPQLTRSYVQVRGDLERLSVALALCETLDRWLPDEQVELEAYTVLIVALEALEGGVVVEHAAAWALWRWLALLGYSPDLSQCAACGKAFDSTGAVLSPTAGALLCPPCAPPSEGVALPADALLQLQQWMQGERLSLGARPEACRVLARAALRYAECVLETPVRWLEFWERLNTLRESG
ncbi:MAG: DNA repair protein RecO [bacterium]|nr:DNA repair protein RecO [bacterium]